MQVGVVADAEDEHVDSGTIVVGGGAEGTGRGVKFKTFSKGASLMSKLMVSSLSLYVASSGSFSGSAPLVIS